MISSSLISTVNSRLKWFNGVKNKQTESFSPSCSDGTGDKHGEINSITLGITLNSPFPDFPGIPQTPKVAIQCQFGINQHCIRYQRTKQ